jgi:hypothetical protein
VLLTATTLSFGAGGKGASSAGMTAADGSAVALLDF